MLVTPAVVGVGTPAIVLVVHCPTRIAADGRYAQNAEPYILSPGVHSDQHETRTMTLLGRFIDAPQFIRVLCLAGICMACSVGARAESTTTVRAKARHPVAPVHEPVVANPTLDRSGDKRRGKASFYARMFSGRRMADGTPMQPQSNNAASKTLPLGTTAKVTNLETGKSAVVTIRDRGPYIKGRIVDLSPSTARKIGIDHKKGVAKVEVAPILVPLADGRLKFGAAVADAERVASNRVASDRVASDD